MNPIYPGNCFRSFPHVNDTTPPFLRSGHSSHQAIYDKLEALTFPCHLVVNMVFVFVNFSLILSHANSHPGTSSLLSYDS